MCDFFVKFRGAAINLTSATYLCVRTQFLWIHFSEKEGVLKKGQENSLLGCKLGWNSELIFIVYSLELLTELVHDTICMSSGEHYLHHNCRERSVCLVAVRLITHPRVISKAFINEYSSLPWGMSRKGSCRCYDCYAQFSHMLPHYKHLHCSLDHSYKMHMCKRN